MVVTLGEEELRAKLDDNGVLRPGALPPPPRGRTYAIFSQRPDVMLDIEGIKRQATRFFGTKVGLTVDKRYGDAPPLTDAARMVVKSDDESASGTRLLYGRAADAADVAAAEEAERQQGTTGMALLAQRCPTIWLVVPESDDDRVALTIAAIFASTMLGPILVPGGGEVFGVKTARSKLERR